MYCMSRQVMHIAVVGARFPVRRHLVHLNVSHLVSNGPDSCVEDANNSVHHLFNYPERVLEFVSAQGIRYQIRECGLEASRSFHNEQSCLLGRCEPGDDEVESDPVVSSATRLQLLCFKQGAGDWVWLQNQLQEYHDSTGIHDVLTNATDSIICIP